MHQLFEALLYGFQKSSPIITIDSTSFPIFSSAIAFQYEAIYSCHGITTPSVGLHGLMNERACSMGLRADLP